ncbi:MAG: hypothetical protein KA991_06090 [Bifidobacterium sp.]|nr:hypothetical protein [Bifidobacterium sp.]
MANNTLHTCTCPRCNSAGRSVAAMNYAETQRWDKRGTFSGSGVGIGTGGIGIGFGGGTYSEHGEQQTKRADVFEEPARFAKPVLGVVVFGMIVMAAYSSAPGILGDMATSSGADPMSELSSSLMPVLAVVAPVVALLIGGMAVMTALRNQKEEDRLNKEVWPKQVHRYNQLRYCEHCHILFDAQGRSADGSEMGFSQMMAYLD